LTFNTPVLYKDDVSEEKYISEENDVSEEKCLYKPITIIIAVHVKEEQAMKLVLLSMLIALVMTLVAGRAEALTPDEMLEKIQWLGQATVRIEAGEQIIYIDPVFNIKETHDADVILVTHSHQDHYNVNTIGMLMKEGTVVIAPGDISANIDQALDTATLIAEPGFTTEVGNITIEAVPAYNVVKTNFHPRANKWVGYVLTIDGVRVYHAGDTERIPEMQDFTADIAMLPLGQTYTMNSVEEAADAARDVKAKIAIPIHYGMYEGSEADAQKFADLLQDEMTVVLMDAPR
jgi:L-ascorbate metabolism protein UlaG (beta-lactamase superfamily)